MFIGRTAELNFLENQYKTENAQLIFLYGRRRIGKTETLKEFCKNKPHIFYSCAQTTNEKQLLDFSEILLREKIPAANFITSFNSWEQAFESINDLPFGNAKKLVVIDEFPYMCKGNPSIPSILQNLWDNFLKDKNVMIILCGSAMSFIEKKLLASKNPLYGRATGIYKMTEMDFYDAIKFFPDYSPEEKILAYSILGGIPHYLQQFDKNLSLDENIKQKILTKGTVLYSEVEFILHQELRETAIYNTIIQAVALGATTLGEISQKSLLNNTSKTSIYLNNLIDLGIIKKHFSVDASLKQQGNSNKGLYSLTDNFFRFWYAFGYSNISDLEDRQVDDVFQYAIKPNLHNFTASAFENICIIYLKKLKAQNKLPFRFHTIGQWFGKTTVRDSAEESGVRKAETEIDILAFDQEKKHYLVGECKFKNKPFQYSEYLDTIAKLGPEQKNAEFYYTLLSLSGFEDKLVEEAEKKNNISLIGADDVVEA